MKTELWSTSCCVLSLSHFLGQILECSVSMFRCKLLETSWNFRVLRESIVKKCLVYVSFVLIQVFIVVAASCRLSMFFVRLKIFALMNWKVLLGRNCDKMKNFALNISSSDIIRDCFVGYEFLLFMSSSNSAPVSEIFSNQNRETPKTKTECCSHFFAFSSSWSAGVENSIIRELNGPGVDTIITT